MSLLNKRKKDDGKKGLLFLIVGSLLAFIATALFALGVTSLTGVLVEARHGGEIAYSLSSLTLPCIGIAMLLAYGILAVWYIAPSEKEVAARNRGLSPMLGQNEAKAMPKTTLWLITGGLLLCIVITGAVSLGTYKLVSETGVTNYVCFIKTDSRTWDEVQRYHVSCDSDKGLTMTFTMGENNKTKNYEILVGVSSTTDAFDQKYTSTLHFAADLDDTLFKRGVIYKNSNLELAKKFYKDDPLRWEYVSKIINYQDIVFGDEDLVPETEAPTEAPTE